MPVVDNGDIITALEARIAALEARLTDSSQPSYLTVDPAGNVGAVFTGLIEALGLRMQMAPGNIGNPPDESIILWYPRSTMDPDLDARMSVGTDGLGNPKWRLFFTNPAATQINLDLIGWNSVTSRWESSFLYPDSAIGANRVRYGVRTVAAAGAPTNTVTFNHALGATPQLVFVTIGNYGNAPSVHVHCKATQITNTQITVQSHMDNEANVGATDFAWMAIG